jgi:hypothetical protein
VTTYRREVQKAPAQAPGRLEHKVSKVACTRHLSQDETRVSRYAHIEAKTFSGEYSQLSRSRAVLMHSHERAAPPKTPHAAHSGPISAQVPPPSQRFFFGVDRALVGHGPSFHTLAVADNRGFLANARPRITKAVGEAQEQEAYDDATEAEAEGRDRRRSKKR